MERKLRRSCVANNAPPALTVRELAGEIAAVDWVDAAWKAADGSTRRACVAWQRIGLAHGPRRTNGALEEAWLPVDWPAGDAGPYHYFLCTCLTWARVLRAIRLRPVRSTGCCTCCGAKFDDTGRGGT